ncbi:peptidoglycan recognition protein family protein [Roseateles violae]|uniref:Peptidoglycan recognition family protein n=1 Tax=Roseateles violae TaxID=3058042 RepID=A0ABT8DYV1_9BURK|nr:peptidoglycan recognition family protein [Pelomonas sp. PFR6]MDN3922762.1 peptidoglycan recognition family protein [Pelomonas sp. PFR6]
MMRAALLRRGLLAALPLLLAACAATPPPPPAIIPVAAWGGEPGPASGARQTISRITLHHQGETWVVGHDPAAYLRRLQQWSRLSKRWADIPYHYVIAPDGRIYAARPPEQAGDTNTEYDPRGHALVMLLGNFEEVEPSREQLLATAELMAWLARAHRLSPELIASHKDYSAQTVCPGRNLYAYLENGWLRRAVAARMAGQPAPPL